MELSFSFSPWYLAIIVLLAGLLSWWMYRGTKDLLPRIPRVILGIFRFLALAIAGVLLLEPLLNSQTRVESPPIVAVMQDVSESIVIQKDSAFVRQEYPTALKQFLASFDPNEYEVDFYTYAKDLQINASPDSLKFGAAGTNISDAMQKLHKLYQNQNLGAVVMISDGISTQGANPLFAIDRFKQPVYTVLLGDTTPQRDVKITEVLYNEIAYLKSEMPIRVKVQSDGFEVAEVKVTLRGGGKVLGVKPLSLGRNKTQGEVDFLIEPAAPGIQQYQLSITHLPDEITYRNNSRRIFINVLETRVKIALFAGSPHPDLGALTEAFKREDRYEVSEFIHKSPSEFYTSPQNVNLDEFDLFILHNFPQNSGDKKWVEAIEKEVAGRKAPVIHLVGLFTDLRTLQPLYKHMAITPKDFNARGEEVIANFSPNYQEHSTFTFGPDWVKWANSSPPIFRNRSNWEPKSTAEVFATARIKNIALDYPVYALQSHLGRKNMVFLGENFWRIRAHSYLEFEDFNYFDDWLFNNIKWLIVTDDKRKFKVAPSKRLYTGGEQILFKGQAYDDSYNPISGVEIKLSMKSPDGKENIYYLNETSQAQYFLELYSLGEGTYTYIAEGKLNEVPIGTDKGQFSIGKSNIEHFRLQADQTVMRQLALRTGGSFVFAQDMADLAEKVKATPGLKPTVDFKKNRKDFHHFQWIMILLLTMLAVEWVTRKLYSLL